MAFRLPHGARATSVQVTKHLLPWARASKATERIYSASLPTQSSCLLYQATCLPAGAVETLACVKRVGKSQKAFPRQRHKVTNQFDLKRTNEANGRWTGVEEELY